MSDASIDTYFNAVADVARVAGAFAFQHYGRNIAVDIKTDGSPVTIADRGAEERAHAWIEERFPGDGILGEEFGTSRPDAKRQWLIDPIDGTKSFVRTVPLWGTLVAVTEGDRVLAGCAYFPVVDELIVAAEGQGCFLNGTRCNVSQIDQLRDATVLITDERFITRPARGERWRALAREAAVSRTWGDCYGYLLVATGRAEVMVDDIVSPWDAAALLPIITEAGGVFSTWTGAHALGGDVIATNHALANDVRARLQESTL